MSRLMLCVVVLLALRTDADAHGGLPISQKILREGNGETMYIPVVYWGIWVGTRQGPWSWICEEAINLNRARRIALCTDGAFYATDSPGLTVSVDRGCTWKSVTGELATARSVDVAVDPIDGATAFVTTATGAKANPDGSLTPAVNGVFITHDHGQTFARMPGLVTSRLFNSVKVSPSDPKSIYVTSYNFTPPFDVKLHRSTDSGATFSETPVPLQIAGTPLSMLDVMAVDPRDPSTIYARGVVTVPDVVPGELVTKHVLYFSADGGTTFVEIASQNAVTVSGGFSKGIDDLAFDVAHERVLVATQKGLLAGPAPKGATTIALTPTGNLAQTQCIDVRQEETFVCSNNFAPDSAAVAVSGDDGLQFQPVFQFHMTQGPVTCPAGTPVADLCPGIWSSYADQLGINLGTVDAGTNTDGGTEPPPGGDCTFSPGAAGSQLQGWAVALAIAVGLAVSRRRRSQARL